MTVEPEHSEQLGLSGTSSLGPLDLAYDAFFRFDLTSGQITQWNRGAEEMYGWSRAEAIGRQPQELLKTVHDRPREEIVADIVREGRWSGTVIQTTRAGQQLVVDARWATDVDGEGRPTGILEINRDQTELRRTLSQLEFANHVASQLTSSLEPAQVLDRLLTIAVAASQASHATVARVEGDHAIVEASLDADGAGLTPGMRWRLTMPEVLRALRTRRTVMSGRIDRSRLASDIRDRLPDLAYRLTVPLAMGDRVLGLLSVGRNSIPFTDEQQTAVERIAASAAMALQNAWLYRESIEQREAARLNEERLRLAVEVAGDLADEPDLHHLTRKLLGRALAITGADRGSISRVEGLEIVIEHCIDRTGDGVPAAGERFPLYAAAKEAISSRRPVRAAPDQMALDMPVMAVIQGGSRMRRLLVVPLIVTEELVGLLSIVKRREEDFQPEQVASLQQVAAVAALLLRSARLLDDARKAEAVKSEFINLAGHELRTPLTVLKGYMSILVGGGLEAAPESWRGPIAILQQKLTELDRLVESVILAARADSLQLLPTKLELDLDAQAAAATERARARAEIEGALLTFEPAGSPVRATADPDHLAWILDALINNSLDYSEPPASVTITVDPGPEPAVLVMDRGIGIPPDAHEVVFERFVRLQPSTLRIKSGSGLGLYLCRRLARSMGGDIEIRESDIGKGTVMAVQLQAPERNRPA